MNYRIVLIGIFFLLFISCVTQKKCLEKYPNPPPSLEKVVETITVYKDTTIYVYLPADTVYKTDTVFVDKDGKITYPLNRLDVEYAWSTIEIKNSRVFHYLYQKETEIAKTIEKAIKETSKDSVTVIREPYPVLTPITWWQQTKMNLGVVFIGLVILLIGYQILKLKKIL
jgi:hypothetical protein